MVSFKIVFLLYNLLYYSSEFVVIIPGFGLEGITSYEDFLDECILL